MPNLENFPNPIPIPINQRPSRLDDNDTKLFESGSQQILFGTNPKDGVELWIYNSDGTLATHVSLDATDDSLGLNTVIDNTGAYEYVNLDMTSIIQRLGLEQGRYQLVANFFRTEVGNEIGNKLFITDISPDRTELRLHPTQLDQTIVNDIYEFVVPSVPRTEAQGLVDLIFAKTSDVSRTISDATVMAEMTLELPDTIARVVNSNSYTTYAAMVNNIIQEAYQRTLNNMAADSNNLNIQDADLEGYVSSAVEDIVREHKDAGKVDAKFNIF